MIDPALQDRLYQASPYNVIRLELNREEPGDTEADNRYTRAAGFLQTGCARASSARTTTRALPLRADLRGRGPDAHAARASWPASGSSRSARARSSRTSRPCPGPRPTGWPSTRRPGSTSARSSASIPTPQQRGPADRRGGPARPDAAGGDRPPGRRQPALGRRPTRRRTRRCRA